MTRFAVLQARTQTLTALVLLAALVAVAAVTGVHVSHLYDSLVAPCHSHGDCGSATERFLNQDNFLQNAFTFLLRLAPALIGIFWGAPLLARELETGTYRLAWTQSVSRSRWLLTRLAVVGLTVLGVSAALTITVTWWYRAFDTVTANRYSPFDVRDVVPVGYALFAFAVGTLFGAVLRRTLPAMAATLGAFAIVRVVVTEWVRPHLLPGLHTTTSLLTTNGFGITSDGSNLDLDVGTGHIAGAWVQSTQLVSNDTGRIASAAERSAFLRQHCPGIGNPPPLPGSGHAKLGNPTAFINCRDQAAQKFHLLVTYQPAGRYWAFQWLETGIFVVLALAAAAGGYWWVTRRTS